MADVVNPVEAMQYLKLSQEPPELRALIGMVSAGIERYTGRLIVARDVEEVLDSGGGELLFLRYFPVQGTPQVTDQHTGQAVTGFVTYPQNGILALDGGWPTGRQRYRVTYRAGLAADTQGVPPDLKLAALEWIAARYHRRDPGITQERIGDYSYAAQEADGMPAAVKAVLDWYRVPRGR